MIAGFKSARYVLAKLAVERGEDQVDDGAWRHCITNLLGNLSDLRLTA